MIAHALAVLTLLPLITLRGRALRLWFAIDLATYALAWMVWQQVIGIDPRLAAAGFVATKLALFFVVQAASDEVRWSATRGAVQTLLVLSLVVPQNLRVPIDGDEPFYLLITESIVRDFDLDLSNQYRALERSATGRLDLKPQFGDPTGPNGQQYSRHEPFLSLLLVPGYLMAGLPGAVATIVLFGALLARSTLRMLEDEGIPERTARAVFPFFAFGPPIVYYATRIWPEVPAAFFFVEAIRGIRQRRKQRWVPSLLAMALLKLRFVLVAAALGLRLIRSKRNALIGAAVIAVPLLIIFLITGSVMNVHSIGEVVPGGPREYVRGLLGLILDGAAGIAFQAPFYLLGLFAILRWRSTPEAFRLGLIGSSIYLLILIPRTEWHGGWGPPLRYIAFMMPVLALGAAAMWERIPKTLIAVIAAWTAGLTVHGAAYPWRLFHIANGENVLGESLSRMFGSDFSRLFPSFIRENDAAAIGTVVLVVAAGWALGVGRWVQARPTPDAQRPAAILLVPAIAILLAAGFNSGQQPASVVQFEDAHVMKKGGELHPPEYTIARFFYRGGWVLHAGDSVSFLAGAGTARLEYATGIPATIEIGGAAYQLETTPGRYGAVRVIIPRSGRVTLRCVAGSVNLDRLLHD